MKQLKQLKVAVAVAALLGAMGAQAESLAKADQAMLKQLAQANIAEIEAGRIALDKSQNSEVKAFAQQMIDDHSKGLREVMAVAQSKGVVLPTEPDAKHKAMGKKLQRLSGDAFDREYAAQAGISDHRATHAYLQKVQTEAKDADVKALAAKLEPTVARHLSHVETLSASLDGVSPRTAGTPPAVGASADKSTTTGASGAAGNTGAGRSHNPEASAASKTPANPAKPKADKTSGNTDHPDNPANKDVHPPLKQ
jgi:putative membrane protein